MKYSLLFLVALCLSILPVTVTAAVFRAYETNNLAANEAVTEDAYFAGRDLAVYGSVAGDYIAAGQTVVVEGSVSEDVVLAARSVIISGIIGDDARVFAENVTLSGRVSGDLIVFARRVELSPGAVIEGDLVFAGQELVLNGAVRGNVRPKGSIVRLNALIGGDVEVYAAQDFSLSGSSVIEGTLVYHAPREISFPETSVVRGGVTFLEYKGIGIFGLDGFYSLSLLFMFFYFLSLLVAVLLAALLAPKASLELVQLSMNQFWYKTLLGLILFIAVPVLAFLLIVTVLGATIGLLLLVAYFFIIVLGCVVASLLIGGYLRLFFWRTTGIVPIIDWKTALLGTAVYLLISLLPYVGWLAQFIFFLASLGGIFTLLVKRIKIQ